MHTIGTIGADDHLEDQEMMNKNSTQHFTVSLNITIGREKERTRERARERDRKGTGENFTMENFIDYKSMKKYPGKVIIYDEFFSEYHRESTKNPIK